MPQRATPSCRPANLSSTTKPKSKPKSKPKPSTPSSSSSIPSQPFAKNPPPQSLSSTSVSTSSLRHAPSQVILTHFSTTLSLSSPSPSSLLPTIQAVKSALYARDFATAFGNEDFLRAYAARWSPARALGYAGLVGELGRVLGLLLEGMEGDDGEEHGEDSEYWVRDVVCLGGGAGAELVGLSVAWGSMNGPRIKGEGVNGTGSDGESGSGITIGTVSGPGSGPRKATLRLHLVDSAAWGTVLNLLGKNIHELLPKGCEIEYQFYQLNILSTSGMDILGPLLAKADLVTVFFTLNELYAVGLAPTTKFLLEIGGLVKTACKVCVVDSAGSYAGVTFQHEREETEHKDQKRYPMAWMLDHTMLELASKDTKTRTWSKITAEESRWFRREKDLEYPLQLEDMRYQLHIYERI